MLVTLCIHSKLSNMVMTKIPNLTAWQSFKCPAVHLVALPKGLLQYGDIPRGPVAACWHSPRGCCSMVALLKGLLQHGCRLCCRLAAHCTAACTAALQHHHDMQSSTSSIQLDPASSSGNRCSTVPGVKELHLRLPQGQPARDVCCLQQWDCPQLCCCCLPQPDCPCHRCFSKQDCCLYSPLRWCCRPFVMQRECPC